MYFVQTFSASRSPHITKPFYHQIKLLLDNKLKQQGA